MKINNKLIYRILLTIIAGIYIVEWFVNSVYLRILAGIILIVAITLSFSKKERQGTVCVNPTEKQRRKMRKTNNRNPSA